MFDCIIVGGGPAGLSAALIMGRCRRSVLVCDAGRPRNARTTAIHGFLTRDGTSPAEFLQTARGQLAKYSNVQFRHADVVEAECLADKKFGVVLASGARFEARTLVLATGIIDELPSITGLDELYGRSVFHCPYCDGWEWRDRPIAVYGRGASGAGLASTVSLWSRDLVLLTDGDTELSTEQTAALHSLDLRVISEPITRLEGDDGQLNAIHFADGSQLAREVMFVCTRQVQASTLAAQMGCEDRARRTVPTADHQKTEIEGLYVVGDASRDVQMVVIAAAEGADAAFAINKYLLSHELPAELLD
jgi:thioredoxin reductase